MHTQKKEGPLQAGQPRRNRTTTAHLNARSAADDRVLGHAGIVGGRAVVAGTPSASVVWRPFHPAVVASHLEDAPDDVGLP